MNRKFYHYAPVEYIQNILQHGIISPYYAHEILKQYQYSFKMYNKYRKRALLWDKTLQRKSPEDLSLTDIQNAIRLFRQHEKGDAYIYALAWPIEKNTHHLLDRFIKNKLEICFNVQDIEHDLIDVYWGKGVDNPNVYYTYGCSEESYYANVDTELLFKNVTHPGFLINDYHIPINLIQDIKVILP